MKQAMIAIGICILACTTAAAETARQTQAATDSRQAPLGGTNTFSERVIRERLAGAGYTRIMGLRLDENGIWRATAMRNNAMVPVSVDYRMEIFER